MESPQLIHTDGHRFSLGYLFTPMLALAVIAIGTLNGDPFTLLIGTGFAAYVWFARHTRYNIFSDKLVILYGRPRRRVVLLEDITEISLLSLGFAGQALFVQAADGQRLMLKPSSPEVFLERLENARTQLR